MNLIIDIGNTFIKLAVFEQDRVIKHTILREINSEKINKFISKHTIKHTIISTVRPNETYNVLKKYNLLTLSHSTAIPLKNCYQTPKTLGLDRLAAMVGAAKKFPNSDVLTIDMGTCITFDFLSAKKEYLGGSISPGFEMRFKALHHFTGKLPLIEYDNHQNNIIGNSTVNSIKSGIYNGIKHEITGMINQYITQYPKLKIIVTGGDEKRFDLEAKNRIFADEFIVLKGLNEILNYNDKTE
jgi:type III pantothenate kinase